MKNSHHEKWGLYVSSSFSVLGLHYPKEIKAEESPSGKNYGKTEAIRVKIKARGQSPQREN